MASGINPLKTVYSVNLGNIGDKSAKITNALANNVNPNISTFHSIFGRQLNSNATRGNSIVENMGLSSSLLSTALTATSSLINQLEDMKNDLLGLSDASPALLAIGQSTYQAKVASVIAFIRDARFGDKKLFDGSLASGVPAGSGIVNPSPLQIQNGFNSFITRALPRLLAGDGTVLDSTITIPGQFQPLFPNTNTFYGSQNIVANEIKTSFGNLAVVTMAQVTNAITVTNSGNPAAIKIFANTLFVGVSNQSGILDISNANIANTKNAIHLVANFAANFLESALTANGGDSSTLSAAEINQARDDIKAVYNVIAGPGITSGDVRAAAATIDATTLYPARANILLRSVYDSIVTAVRETGNAMSTIDGGGDDAAGAAGTALKAAIIVSIDSIMLTVQAITAPEGNVGTAVERAQVTSMLNDAINILDVIGAQLTGDQDSLEVGKAAVKQQIIALNNAANTILSADYEKLVPELTELRRLVTILSMAFGIEETILNTVINKLEGLSG